MALSALTRLLELVQRTRLPLIVQSSDSTEPCVVLPLSLYERLLGEVSEGARTEEGNVGESSMKVGPPWRTS